MDVRAPGFEPGTSRPNGRVSTTTAPHSVFGPARRDSHPRPPRSAVSAPSELRAGLAPRRRFELRPTGSGPVVLPVTPSRNGGATGRGTPPAAPASTCHRGVPGRSPGDHREHHPGLAGGAVPLVLVAAVARGDRVLPRVPAAAGAGLAGHGARSGYTNRTCGFRIQSAATAPTPYPGLLLLAGQVQVQRDQDADQADSTK